MVSAVSMMGASTYKRNQIVDPILIIKQSSSHRCCTRTALLHGAEDSLWTQSESSWVVQGEARLEWEE